MTKVRGFRAAEAGKLYVQFDGKEETFVMDAGSSHAEALILAYIKGEEAKVETSAATGPGDYHTVTGVYLGRWQ